MQVEIEINALTEPERDLIMIRLFELGCKPYGIGRNRCIIRFCVDQPSIIAGVKLMRMVRTAESK